MSETIETTDTDIAPELRAAFEEFTGAANDRLSANDKAIAEIRSKLEGIERIARRPGARGAAPETREEQLAIEKRAFTAWARGKLADEAPEVRAAITTTTGGAMVPTQLASFISKLLATASPIRQFSNVVDCSSTEIRVPVRTANMAAAWVSETAARTESEPTYDTVTITPAELAVRVFVSQALVEDAAFDLAAEIASNAAENFAVTEGTAFVKGDGSGKPAGFAVNTDVLANKVTAASATEIALADLLSVYGALPASQTSGAAWFANKKTIAAIMAIQLSQNGILLPPGLAGSPFVTLLGLPLVPTPDMDDIAAGQTPLVLGNMKNGYVIADRVGLSALIDPYSQNSNGQIVYSFRRRVSGAVVQPDAFVPLVMAAS